MSNGLNAAAFVASATTPKPQLVVHGSNLPATVIALCDLFAASNGLFDRGGPVQVIKPANGNTPIAAALTKHGVVMEAHRSRRHQHRTSPFIGWFNPIGRGIRF